MILACGLCGLGRGGGWSGWGVTKNIPGCGPQIMFTTLYLSGAFPLSAQFGNAIANDGDALFPAIAVASKAALVATLYSGVPAVMVAYSWFLLVELEP